MQTRKLVLSLAAVLVLALVAPVVGQPFADVPTNHWAYDAIAELAAKGLVEGYPDGTFKGNQPMTRYEMAMVVARIIARIEAIPTPPPPEVRRADLDAVRRDLTAATGRIAASERTIATLQRLVNEFRAELQALGVRVTALEEELSALRARLDNTRVTGDFIWWYTTTDGSVTGLTGGFSGVSFTPSVPRLDLSRIRLTYTGTVAPNVSATLRARNYTGIGTAPTVDYDRLFISWGNAFGLEGLTVWVGRGVVTLGPVGLLLDEAAHNQRRDGVWAQWRLGSVDVWGAAQFKSANQSTTETLYAGRLSFSLLPGWTLGLNARVDYDPWTAANQGSGFSGDLTAELVAGLRLTAEYATYNAPNAPSPTNRNFAFARLDIDFERLSGSEITLKPRVGVWYKNFDSLAGTPLAGFPGGQYFSFQDAYFGNAFRDPIVSNLQGFGARLDLQLMENLGAFVTYENYEGKSGEGTLTIWSVGGSWTVAPRTTLNLFYSRLEHSGGQNTQAGGVYVLTSW
jgi:hypothetical protein